MNYIPVIVTYNRLDSLKKALEKLQNQTLNPYKIIVIDNHSTDGTENYMKEKFNASDQVKYYRLNENVGGSGGFSYGVKKALDFNPDWVALSDDDAFYDEKYFEIINKYIVKYPMIKCFSVVKLSSLKYFVFVIIEVYFHHQEELHRKNT